MTSHENFRRFDTQGRLSFFEDVCRLNFKDKNASAVRAVVDAKITAPKDVILCRSDGTEERTVEDRIFSESLMGGGAFFLLDRYVQGFRPGHPRVFESSGLTSDLDCDFEIKLYQASEPNVASNVAGYQDFDDELRERSATDFNEPLLRAVKSFAVQKLKESFARPGVREAIEHIFHFLSSFVEFEQHPQTSPDGEITNLDNGKGILYALDWDDERININVQFNIGDVVHTHHLTDIFFKFSSEKLSLPIVLFEPYENVFLPFDYNNMYSQLFSMVDRYINAWRLDIPGGNGVHQAIPFVRCSNDRNRFQWLLQTIPVLPQSMFKAHNSRDPNFLRDIKHYYMHSLMRDNKVLNALHGPFIRSNLLPLEVAWKSDARLILELGQERVLRAFPGIRKRPNRTLYVHVSETKKYEVSRQVIRVFRLALKIRLIFLDTLGKIPDENFNDPTIWAPTSHELRSKLQEMYDALDASHPETPCNIHETPEYAQEVFRAYREMYDFVSKNAYQHVVEEDGKRIVVQLQTKNTMLAAGRLFAKRIAKRIRGLFV